MAVQNPTDATVNEATLVFSQAMQMHQNEIPRNLLANAQAVAIIPSMVKGAFVFGVQHGKGVLVYRDATTGAWQAPRMIDITGGSVGYQIGIQATDLILVFRTPQSVQNLLKGTLKVGVDASAAAGPVGRQTSASTDTRLAAEILSYSRARGVFAGVAIDGSVISLDPAAEAIYYQPPGSFPASAAQLLQWINAYTSQAAVAPAPIGGQMAPGAGGWTAAGQRGGDTEAVRQQLEAASRQLSANLDENWKRYLALPPEVYQANQSPSPQAVQQTVAKYEEITRRPEYAALYTRSEFQQTLAALKRLGEVRTASNASLALPPPPK
jgi:lipid-binding SYLF domain-containing protein